MEPDGVTHLPPLEYERAGGTDTPVEDYYRFVREGPRVGHEVRRRTHDRIISRAVDHRRVLMIVEDDGPLDPAVRARLLARLSGPTRTAFKIRPQLLRRVLRHRQRCAVLNLQWPRAHPYGWPPVPLGDPLPRPWKKAR